MSVGFTDVVSEQLPAADTLLYTAPANCKSAQIIYVNCTCEDAAGSSFSVNIVQSAGSVAVTNLYLKAKAVTAGATVNASELVGAVLMPGDFISAIAADASRLNLKIGIKEIY